MRVSSPTLQAVDLAISKLVTQLKRWQEKDGRWSFCFENGPMTDAYMILLMRTLGSSNKKLQAGLVERLLAKQTAAGTWKLFADEKEGNRSATVEASLALLYAGAVQPQDERMQKAKQFIKRKNREIGSLTKVMLTLFGHMNWSDHPKIPIEFLLIPAWAPVNFFDLVGYTRVHAAPIMIAADRRFSVELPGKAAVSKWLPPECKGVPDLPVQLWSQQEIFPAIIQPSFLRKELRRRALHLGEQFMLRRVEPDGTLYSYFSSTFLMIFALLSLGYPKHHPVIQRAMKGLEAFVCETDEGTHVQETTSTVWDTSLILYALQEAGVKVRDPVIQRGLRYLLQRQQNKWGDWALRNPGADPGGWGFSDVNTINPDVDDTAASLRALAPSIRRGEYQDAWKTGMTWLLSMQNADGGWPAFEKNTAKAWLKFIPFPDGKMVWGDPSTADLTGRTLQFLGSVIGWDQNHPVSRRAIQWLFKNQRWDGSWFGRWGITFIYGTWSALTALASVGVPRYHPVVEKGIRWLLSIQNKDGGWGESCQSDVKQKYVPLGASTPSQTAWALDALIAYHERPTAEMEAGVRCLLRLLNEDGWQTRYPTGAGLPGGFYIHYHSYRYIWPLVTLAHYKKKYSRK